MMNRMIVGNLVHRPVRSLISIIAVALEVSRYHREKSSGPVTLISSDQALNDAATAEGLTVEDPNSHP